MEDISVAFKVTRTYFQLIDTNGNFKLGEPLHAFCDRYGDIWGDFYDTPLTYTDEYNLYISDIETPLYTLAEEAIELLGHNKAAIFPHQIMTHRGVPVDRVGYLDFYKCYFWSEYEDILQPVSEYFEHTPFTQ